MNVAIIGCGYVGTALAHHLRSLNAGYIITATTRTKSRVDKLLTIVDNVCIVPEGDHKALAAALENQDAVIVSVAAEGIDTYQSTYLGTAITLEKALHEVQSNKTSPIQIIYTGSTSVYGDAEGQVVDEMTPPSPTNRSAHILADTEQALLKISNANTCILRLGEIIGPGRMISDRLRKMGSINGGCVLPGTGMAITNLSYIDNIVAGIEFALKKRIKGIYNLCSDLHITRKELYEKICEKEGLPMVRWDPSKASIHSGNKIVSSDKIRKLGFVESYWEQFR